MHPEPDPDVVRIDPGAVVNWGRTSAHAHAPVPSGRVPMWAIEVLLHRLPRFECSSVFSHLDIHDRVDQCVLTPGYPVVPHPRLHARLALHPRSWVGGPGRGRIVQSALAISRISRGVKCSTRDPKSA